MTRPYIPNHKIRLYLLSSDHPQGRDKARFFLQFGFSLNSIEALETSLKAHPLEAQLIKSEMTPDGQSKLIFECEINVPNGRRPCIRSVWIEEPDTNRLRLVTAYPFQ